MTKFKVFTLMLPLLFASSQVCAQAITEYGKVLGNAKERQGNAKPKASRGVKQRGNAKGVVQGMADVPSIPLPSSLTTEAKGAALHARHDESSDAITHLSGGEKLVPLAETAAGNDHWYMVRTQTGLVGWVKSTEVAKEANRTTGQ